MNMLETFGYSHGDYYWIVCQLSKKHYLEPLFNIWNMVCNILILLFPLTKRFIDFEYKHLLTSIFLDKHFDLF